MHDILTLWENSGKFRIEENEIVFDHHQLDELTKTIINNLLKICGDWKNKTVYIDIKNRKSFILLFIALLKLKSKSVLLPIEINPDDIVNEKMIHISDNKNSEKGIFMNDDLTFVIGERIDENFGQTYTDETESILYLYTSGSTGKPKLIPKNDLNLLKELGELEKNLGVPEDEIFYFTPPLYHIYGLLFGFLLPLYTGSHLIIDYHFTPETVARFVSQKNIGIFISIPAYYSMFSDLSLLDCFRKIKVFTSSSAPLSVDISKKFLDKNMKIVEIYGSTETGGIAYRTGASDERWTLFSYVDIITEVKSCQIKLTELSMTSPAISVMYDQKSGYNTGDLVEFTGDNTFKLSGRNTRFVKIKGKRVDLEYVFRKVINYLKNLSNFQIKDDNLYIGEKDEVIFVIFEFNFPKNNTEMRKELKEFLPGYSVPKYFLNMKIPKNSMGKIDKSRINDLIVEMKKK